MSIDKCIAKKTCAKSKSTYNNALPHVAVVKPAMTTATMIARNLSFMLIVFDGFKIDAKIAKNIVIYQNNHYLCENY